MDIFDLLDKAERRGAREAPGCFDLEDFLLLSGARVEWTSAAALDGWTPSDRRPGVHVPVTARRTAA